VGEAPTTAVAPDELTAIAGDPVMIEVGEALTLDATGSVGAVSYAWSFGDGTSAEASEEPSAVHTYDDVGHLVATVTVTAEDGRTATGAVGVTVVYPLAATPPRHASTIAEADGFVFVVMRDFDLVAVIDAESREVVEHLSTCGEPRTLSAADGWLAVACADDAVDLFDLTGASITPVQTVASARGARPFGVVVAEGSAWISLQGTAQLAAIELSSGGGTLTSVGWDVRGVAWDGADLWLTRHRSEDEGGEVYRVTDSGVDTYPLAMAPGPDSDTDARGVPTYLQHIAISPDGRAAYVSGLNANIERGLYRDGLTPSHETTVRATVRQLSLEAGDLGTEGLRFRYDERGMASAVAFSPRGDWVYAAMLGAQTVDVVDAWTGQAAAGYHDVGEGPDGLWVSDDGVEVWVNASFSREVTVIDTDVGEVVETVDLLPPSGEVLDEEILRGKKIFYASVDPRMTASGYVSCGSCHLDGDQDRRVWDFTDRGEGLRNTISLLGHAGVGHGPIHWSGNFDEVQDFENDVRGPMQGSGFLDDTDWEQTSDTLGDEKAGRSADLDALAAYVESLDTFHLSPYRNADGTLTTGAMAGKQIFESAQTGCTDCHPAPEFTDSAWLSPGVPNLHDVGTLSDGSGQRMGGALDGIDTPTLRGLWETAPYLHNGSAESLGQVLKTRNPSDQHGVTSGLSDDQINQLVEYLLSLE